MLKRLLFTCTLSLIVAAMSSCIFDPKPDPGDPPVPPASYEDLSARWHVLNNVEVSYNKRNINKYDELLDLEFVFFLSPGDVGGEIPAQWDRATEILYNTRLFDPNYDNPQCRSIQMDIQMPEDKSRISWVEIEPTPGEKRYVTTAFYTFRFDVAPDTQYESVPGAKAQFTVRNVGTEDAPQWRLIEFRDLASDV